MSEPSTSRRLGKYRVLKELGRGSFGITSLAEHVGLHTKVVLKELIPSAVGDPTLRDRFIQEARVQAKLSARHAGIAQVTELEEDANPPYYVVEYCDQGDLATLSQELGPWPVGHVVWLIRQVADALSYVHQEMCHRDIKPHNLVLTSSYKSGGQPTVKLIDFGLARLHGHKEVDNPLMTQPGQMLGTMLFCAPEQLRNDPWLDGRCDLFSLGMTAWFMLEGRSPLRGSSGDMMAERFSDGKYADGLPQHLPECVRILLTKLLAKNPADRPMDAQSVVCEADACLHELGFVWHPLVKSDVNPAGPRNIPELYEVSSEIKNDTWGHSMMATVRTDRRPVHLRVLPRLDPGTVARMYQSAGRIRETRCPYLPQFKVEMLEEGMVVAEEVLEGSSDLSTVIRETHAQGLSDCAKLLRALADACDAVKMAELKQFALTISSVQVAVAARRFREMIPQGKFQLRLRSDFAALLPNHSSSATQIDQHGTLAGTLAGGADASMLTEAQRFLRIVYWVLAGREPRATAYWCATDCDPIRGLNEESNVLIRRYLSGGSLPEDFPCSYVLEQICNAAGVAFPASEAGSQVTYMGSSRTGSATGSSGRATAYEQEQPTEIGSGRRPATVATPAPPPPPALSFPQATVQPALPPTTIAGPSRIQLPPPPPPPPPRVLQPPPLHTASRSGLLVTVVSIAILLFVGAGVLIWKTQDNQAKRVIEAEAKAKQEQQARADAEAKEISARQELERQEAAKKAASIAEELKKQELQKELAMAQAKAEAKRKQAEEAEAAKKVALRNSYSKDNCFRNTLGMEFVPIPNTRLLVCNTETRVQDYEVFVNKTNRKPSEIFTGFDMKSHSPEYSNGNWKELGLTQTAGHAVAGVNWFDARDFCLWLTETEAPHKYRLLTVTEWMAAAGGRSFVYGNAFPPAADSGNFCGKEFIKFAKENIDSLLETDDFFPFTSPVKSFKPNELGVYDMGGNLWEWCQDDYSASMNPDPKMKNEFARPGVPYKVTKGGSWFNSQEKLLRTDFCNRDDPAKASVFVGFRIVLDWDSL